MEAVRARAAGRADGAAAALVGRREDELVGRQQHPAHGGAGGDVRPHDADPGRACSRTGGASSPSEPVPAGDPMDGEARARALDRRALARRGGRRARPRSTSRGSCASGEAPDEVEEVRARERRSAVHLPGAPRRAPSASRSSHGRADDRPGRGQARRRAGARARRSVGRARRCDAPGRQARFLASGTRLTPRLRSVLHFPGCPRGRRRKVPANDTNWSSLLGRFGYRYDPSILEASGASRRPFLRRSQTARSLKTQQRAFTSRPATGPACGPVQE